MGSGSLFGVLMFSASPEPRPDVPVPPIILATCGSPSEPGVLPLQHRRFADQQGRPLGSVLILPGSHSGRLPHKVVHQGNTPDMQRSVRVRLQNASTRHSQGEGRGAATLSPWGVFNEGARTVPVPNTRRASVERRNQGARGSAACQLARWRDAKRSRVSARRHPSRSARHPCACGKVTAALSRGANVSPAAGH